MADKLTFSLVSPEAELFSVLAEKASLLSDVSLEAVQADIDAATKALEVLEGDAALVMQQNLDGLKAVTGA